MVRVGETHSVTLTIQNQGNLDLFIDSLSVDNAFVTVSSTTFILNPNSSRDLEVTFTPSLPDSITATLEVYSNDPDEPTLSVSLIGIGGAPEITVSPDIVDFERVSLDSSVSQTVTIMNTGLFDLSADSFATGEEEAFSVSGATFVLNPDSSKMVDVAFTPSEIDSLFDQLTIFSDAFNNEVLTVQMVGVGVSSKIVTSPERINFGIVAIGDSSSSALTIRNEGNELLVVQSITISDQEAFSLSDSSLTIAPNDSSGIQIEFKSLTTGETTAEIRIQSNDRRRDIITVPIFASSLPVPDLFLSETDYSYGLVTSGGSIPWMFAIHNLGTEILTITSITTEPPFGVQSALPETVAVSDSVDIVILFSPSEGRDFEGQLTILTDDPDEPEVNVLLSGSAVDLGVYLDLNRTSGNQKSLSGHASPFTPFEIATYIEGVSEISAYSYIIEFDSSAVQYKGGSEKTDEEDNILIRSGGSALSPPPLVFGNTVSFGTAILGPTSSTVVSGDGFLGVLTFEGNEEFKMSESTQFILREISLKRFGEEEQKILTHVVAEVKSGIPGDFDGDGEVDFDDFFEFAGAFGQSATGAFAKYDLDGAGETIDFNDFFEFAAAFGN